MNRIDSLALKISDEELMAEKLGIIKLCRHCGGRIEPAPSHLMTLLKEILRGQIGTRYSPDDIVWVHLRNNGTRCDLKISEVIANPREESLDY